MEGYLGKRGKRIGSRVKRYMVLQGELLSNHHTPADAPTWTVNVKDSMITCNMKRNRIVLELFNNKLELFADNNRDCERWYEALTNAKSKADIAQGKENSAGDKVENIRIVSLASNSYEGSDTRQRADLGKNFKVVKPTQSMRSNNSDDIFEGNEPLAVQGQIYEETPASMIFKQFNFPAK